MVAAQCILGLVNGIPITVYTSFRFTAVTFIVTMNSVELLPLLLRVNSVPDALGKIGSTRKNADNNTLPLICPTFDVNSRTHHDVRSIQK